MGSVAPEVAAGMSAILNPDVSGSTDDANELLVSSGLFDSGNSAMAVTVAVAPFLNSIASYVLLSFRNEQVCFECVSG